MAMKRKLPPRNAAAWARRIRTLMRRADLSAPELALSMNAAKSTIYHYLLGTRIPAPDVRPLLARKLGVTVDELNGAAA